MTEGSGTDRPLVDELQLADATLVAVLTRAQVETHDSAIHDALEAALTTRDTPPRHGWIAHIDDYRAEIATCHADVFAVVVGGLEATLWTTPDSTLAPSRTDTNTDTGTGAGTNTSTSTSTGTDEQVARRILARQSCVERVVAERVDVRERYTIERYDHPNP